MYTCMYSNNLAAIADYAEPAWRASALGTYRFWRDSGYFIGAILSGALADWCGDTLTTLLFLSFPPSQLALLGSARLFVTYQLLLWLTSSLGRCCGRSLSCYHHHMLSLHFPCYHHHNII